MTGPGVATTNASARSPIVAGVDDSQLGMNAVQLAAREAALHGRPLRIVHSFNWSPDPDVPIEDELRQPTEQLLERALDVASRVDPTIEITSALIEGPPVTTLLRESGSATLLVIGDGNLAGCDCVPADTNSVQIAARAGSSVLIGRERLPPPGPVLVGVDGSTSSYAAIDLAFDAAARRGRDLVVVRVWEPAETPDQVDDAVVDELAEMIAPWQRKYPTVPVRLRVHAGDPREKLVAESRDAELAVVSARGEEAWRGMLGAVSQALLYHSPAPVLVVRTPHELYIQE